MAGRYFWANKDKIFLRKNQKDFGLGTTCFVNTGSGTNEVMVKIYKPTIEIIQYFRLGIRYKNQKDINNG